MKSNQKFDHSHKLNAHEEDLYGCAAHGSTEPSFPLSSADLPRRAEVEVEFIPRHHIDEILGGAHD